MELIKRNIDVSIDKYGTSPQPAGLCEVIETLSTVESLELVKRRKLWKRFDYEEAIMIAAVQPSDDVL